MKHLKTIYAISIMLILSFGSAQCQTDTTKVKDRWLSIQFSHGSGLFENFKDFTVLPGSVIGIAPSFAQRIGKKDKKFTYLSLGLRLQRYLASFDVKGSIETLAIMYFSPVIQLSDNVLLFTSGTGDIKLYLNPSAGIFPNYLLSVDAGYSEIERSDIAKRWTYGLYGGLGFMCTFADEYSFGAGAQFEVAFSNPNSDEFSYSQLGSLYLNFGKNIGRSKKTNTGLIRQDF